jgi:hypothetical protein
MWSVVELKWRKDCYRLNTAYKRFFFSEYPGVASILPLKVSIEDHVARVTDVLILVHWALHILTGCTVNTRKGIL